MPVHAFIETANLLDKGLTNYWGYNTIGFLPRSRVIPLCRTFRVLEFKREWWPACMTPAWKSFWTSSTTTLRRVMSEVRRVVQGIDNASYYRLMPESASLHQRHPAPATRST